MADFFAGGAPAIGLWFLGVALLGAALVFGGVAGVVYVTSWTKRTVAADEIAPEA